MPQVRRGATCKFESGDKIMAEPNGFGNFIRTATRPVLTVIGLMAWVAFIEEGIEPPVEFKILVGGMVGSWFGERTIKRLQERQP